MTPRHCCSIYAQYIETTITFEYTLPTEQAFSERIASISSVYPYLVCEEGGRAVGYAYAHRQMEREAYQWNAELSIYLDPSVTSKGLGRKLYGVLMEVLKLQNIKTVYGVVTQPNLKSEKLHLSMGFTRAGFFPEHGLQVRCMAATLSGLKSRSRHMNRSLNPSAPSGSSRAKRWKQSCNRIVKAGFRFDKPSRAQYTNIRVDNTPKGDVLLNERM